MKALDYESFYFFYEIFKNFERIDEIGNLFDDDEFRSIVIKNINTYLKDEEAYNKIKSKIKNIIFNYVNGNIFEDEISGKFDNIFLSNLCAVAWAYENIGLIGFKNRLERLSESNLNINGSILLGYLWNTTFDSKKYLESWNGIYNMSVTKEVLKDFITEYHHIKGVDGIHFETEKIK